MNVKFIGKGSDQGKVHIKASDDKTACGEIISDNPQDWKDTNESVTCEKNGCKNK